MYHRIRRTKETKAKGGFAENSSRKKKNTSNDASELEAFSTVEEDNTTGNPVVNSLPPFCVHTVQTQLSPWDGKSFALIKSLRE